MAVVVPAHNEEEELGRCLAALASCASPGVPVEVIVVLDSCTDGTRRIATDSGVRTVVVDDRNVGAARAAGVAAALGPGPTGAGVFIANTDADTVVPANWLVSQLRYVAAGADVVVGTVAVVDWTPWPAHVPPVYLNGYAHLSTGDTHRHVHGANLGFTDRAYRVAGGFPPLRVSEDRAFVEAAHRRGLRVVWATDLAVTTSARPFSRVADGFAGHLRRIAEAAG